MVFHLILHHIARTAFLLFGNIALQFRRRERLLLTLREHQVHGFHLNQRVQLVAAGYLLLHALQGAYLPVDGLPVVARVADGVVLDDIGIQLTHHLLVVKLIERKTVTRLADVVVLRDIRHYALVNHQLDVTGRRVLLVVLVE